MKKYILTIILLITTLICKAQEKVVEYNIDTGKFTGNIPFDERFKIKFTSASDIIDFTVGYKIKYYDKDKPAKTDKYYFQKLYPVDDEGYISETRTVNAKEFSIGNLGPLHANTPYDFKFSVLKKIVLDKEKEKSLKEDIQKYLNYIYLENDSIPTPEVVIEALKVIVKKHIKGDIYKEDRKIVTELDLLKTLQPQINELINFKSNKNSTIVLHNAKLEILKLFITQSIIGMRPKIANINSITTNIAAVDKPVNISIEELKTAGLSQFIDFLKDDFNVNLKNILSVVSGEKFLKLVNNKLTTVKTSKKYDNIKSLQFIAVGFEKLEELKNKAKPAKPYFSNTENSELKNFSSLIVEKQTDESNTDGFIALSEKILSYNETTFKEVTNIFAGMYVEQVLAKADINTVTDVQTKASPYINMDIGGLFATDINDAFILETINFHFSPVNRDALFSDIKGFWDNVGKRTSFQIGLAQRIGPTDARYENYLAGSLGTPYLGIGVRLSRILRVSGGVIFYQQANVNPLIDDKTTKGSFAFTITINSALSKALGELADFVNND